MAEVRTGKETWQEILQDLEQRRARARAMGGAEKLERRRSAGRLNARERVLRFCDPGTFREIGTLVESLAEGGPGVDSLVGGIGKVDGRDVVVLAEDFTVLGGSIGVHTADKRCRLVELAGQERVPLVWMLEGAGHRAANLLRDHGRTPNDLQAMVDLSGLVPTVCLVLGPSAGHGALAAPLSDFVIMGPGSALFTAGPPLVAAALGERVDKDTLGGPAVHLTQSGVAHNGASTEEEAFALARRYLGYFPQSAWEAPPRRTGDDAGPRRLDGILDVIPPDPHRPYDIHQVIDMLVDRGSFLEIQPAYGASMVTGLAFLGGRAAAVVANNPGVRAGAIDTAAARKAARFLEVVGSFHLPVVFLADNPGVLPGTAAERAGILRDAARLYAAQRRLRGVKISVTLRKAFGFGSSVMAMNPFDRQTLSLAFPAVSLGAMPGSAAPGISEADRDRLVESTSRPWRVASSMVFDEIIDPRELRNAVLWALSLGERRAAQAPGPVRHVGPLP